MTKYIKTGLFKKKKGPFRNSQTAATAEGCTAVVLHPQWLTEG